MPDRGSALRPVFLQVNVYRSRGDWFVTWGMRRAGGPFPRSVSPPRTVRVAGASTHRGAAFRAAARALEAAADDLDDP